MKSGQQLLLSIASLVGIFITALLIYKLSPILTPFLIAATLAYLIDPLVEWLNIGKCKIPRTLAVVGVFIMVSLVLFIAFFYLIPLLQHQLSALLAKIPTLLEWIQENLLPQLVALGLAPSDMGIDSLKTEAFKHVSEARQMAQWIWYTLFHSGEMIFSVIMNVLIIFVAAFYLLRDWPIVLQSFRKLLPVSIAPTALRIAARCDYVLASFVRGQLTLMVALGTFYTLGLAILGINFSLLLGMLAGLLNIVPYLGSILGLGSAVAIAYFQFQEWLPILGVLIVFGLGHLLEIVVLMPMLVGDKLGLHPVAVIFAVLAGGQLLGFAGVILALPIAAILVVLGEELLNKMNSQAPLVISTSNAKGQVSGE